MKQTLTLDIPDEIFQALEREAARTRRSLEQTVLDWIAQCIQQPQRGSPEALRPLFGAWSMTVEERTRIEQMIDEERHTGIRYV